MDLAESRRLMDAAAGGDPEAGLTAVVALRQLVELRLYGLLHDARDPLGTQLSRRSRRRLAALGWTAGRPNPLRLLLQARGIDPVRLAAELGKSP